MCRKALSRHVWKTFWMIVFAVASVLFWGTVISVAGGGLRFARNMVRQMLVEIGWRQE